MLIQVDKEEKLNNWSACSDCHETLIPLAKLTVAYAVYTRPCLCSSVFLQVFELVKFVSHGMGGHTWESVDGRELGAPTKKVSDDRVVGIG